MSHNNHGGAHAYRGTTNGRAQRTSTKLRRDVRPIDLKRLERLLRRKTG